MDNLKSKKANLKADLQREGLIGGAIGENKSRMQAKKTVYSNGGSKQVAYRGESKQIIYQNGKSNQKENVTQSKQKKEWVQSTKYSTGKAVISGSTSGGARFVSAFPDVSTGTKMQGCYREVPQKEEKKTVIVVEKSGCALPTKIVEMKEIKKIEKLNEVPKETSRTGGVIRVESGLGTSQSLFDKKPQMKIIDIHDLPSVSKLGEHLDERLKESNVSSRKSTVYKTMNISDLQTVNKKEKKVIEMGKKLVKEKIIILNDGQVKKEESEVTLMMKKMEEEKEEEEEEKEEEEENEEEEESELKLEKEIKKEMEAQMEKEGNEEEEEEEEVRENEEKENEEEKQKMIVETVFDEYMKKYETNQSMEEEKIISEFKEIVLQNYLDETVDRGNVSKSFVNEKTGEAESITEDLKKKIEEFPQFLKEAQETGKAEEMVKKAQEEKEEREEAKRTMCVMPPEMMQKEIFEEVVVEAEKPKIVDCGEVEVNAKKEEVHEDEEVDEEFTLTIQRQEKETKVHQVFIPNKRGEGEEEEEEGEVIEIIHGHKNHEESFDHKMEHIDHYIQDAEEAGFFDKLIQEKREKETKEKMKNEEMEKEKMTVGFNQNKEKTVKVHKVLIPNKREDKEEEDEGEVIEIIHGHEDHEEDFDHKMEHIDHYIQDAKDAGFFDKLIQEKREKEAQKTEKMVIAPMKKGPQLVEKAKAKKFSMNDIKKQLIIDANIKGEKKPEPVKEESDIDFSDAFESEKEEKAPEPSPIPPVSNLSKNIDSFDRRRYGNMQDYSLSQSRLKTSGGNWSSTSKLRETRTEGGVGGREIGRSKGNGENRVISSVNTRGIGGANRITSGGSRGRVVSSKNRIGSGTGRVISKRGGVGQEQPKTSGVRRVQLDNVNRSGTSQPTIRAGSDSAREIYKRFEKVNEMKPLVLNKGNQQVERKSKIDLNTWTSRNKTESQTVGHFSKRTPTQTENTQRQNDWKEKKLTTLGSLIKSNIENQTEKKMQSSYAEGLTSARKEEVSKARTPTTRKKRINLSHYRSKNMESVGSNVFSVTENRKSIGSGLKRSILESQSGVRTAHPITSNVRAEENKFTWVGSGDLQQSIVLSERPVTTRRIKL